MRHKRDAKRFPRYPTKDITTISFAIFESVKNKRNITNQTVVDVGLAKILLKSLIKGESETRMRSRAKPEITATPPPLFHIGK